MCASFKKYELSLKLGCERSYKSLQARQNMYIPAFQKLNYGNNVTVQIFYLSLILTFPAIFISIPFLPINYFMQRKEWLYQVFFQHCIYYFEVSRYRELRVLNCSFGNGMFHNCILQSLHCIVSPPKCFFTTCLKLTLVHPNIFQ